MRNIIYSQCELNFIEMVWAKAHHRSTCTYKYNDLRTGLPVTFDELMPSNIIIKFLCMYINKKNLDDGIF